MTLSTTRWLHARALVRRQSAPDGQHRTAFYLIAGNLIATVAGLVFWLLFARVSSLPAAEIGIGFAIVGLGATIGVLAKGGLDTSLVRSVPESSSAGATRLLRFGALIGTSVALTLTALVGIAALHFGLLPQVDTWGWALVGAMAALLVITWLQDAHQLAEGNARFAVHRNLTLAVTRVALPLPIIALAWYRPVAMTWVLAVAASSFVALVIRRRPVRAGRTVTRAEFARRSMRHEASSASEFLPGLLLAPIIMGVAGPSAAGHFAIVWAAASILFVFAAAIGRSALARMARDGPSVVASVIRKAALQLVVIVAPAALIGALLPHMILGIFGPQYATEGAATFMILCASVVFLAPSYLYLAVLRAADRTVPLIVFPAIMLAAVIVLTPMLASTYGLRGAGAAWLLGNAPLGLYATWRLWSMARETHARREGSASHHPTAYDASPDLGSRTVEPTLPILSSNRPLWPPHERTIATRRKVQR